ncbi:MAG: hypothetical protein EZS28_040437 [Streblomastix strix]|uniref:Uncharacterized protein n=1 Tax=Streblomastix strix TaxID=222440 RepID=A0A5J4U321_9EUKA|nr:MAG: hypothetical protein EZS28_040437 [Streblomastix strix]
MNNTFSETETQQETNYIQVAKKLGGTDQVLYGSWSQSINGKRSTNELRCPFLSLRTALVAQCPLDITEHIHGGASADDIVYQPRIQANRVTLDHHEETSIIIDITNTRSTKHKVSFEKKRPNQLEDTGLPSLTRTRWNLEILGGGQQNKTGGDTRICLQLRSQLKCSQENRYTYSDCARAVSLAESVLIALIHYIMIDQPPSRNLIDAYLMCLTAGARLRSIHFAHSTQGLNKNQALANYISALAKFLPIHDNALNNGRRKNHRKRGHSQSNDNQRAQNCERRAEKNHQWLILIEGKEFEQNGAQNRMVMDYASEDDDNLLV